MEDLQEREWTTETLQPQASLRCSQPTSSPNRFAPLIDFSEDRPSREEGVDKWGDVVDDAVEVGVRVEGMGI